MTQYNKNLASEFWVLSMLYRFGADASLTLGNKKSVDIVVVNDAGIAKTVDVKGVAGPYDWPADNIRLPGPDNHYYAFLTFNGRIDRPDTPPDVWIVPANKLEPLIKRYKTRSVVSRARVRSEGAGYRQAWHHLIDELAG